MDAAGNVHDVTPRDDEESGVLFVADPIRTFNGVPIDNVRRALRQDDRLTTRYLDLAARFAFEMNHGELKSAAFGRVELPPVLYPVYEALGKAGEYLSYVTDPVTPRNSPCRCGSGNKFKRCHGALNN